MVNLAKISTNPTKISPNVVDISVDYERSPDLVTNLEGRMVKGTKES